MPGAHPAAAAPLLTLGVPTVRAQHKVKHSASHVPHPHLPHLGRSEAEHKADKADSLVRSTYDKAADAAGTVKDKAAGAAGAVKGNVKGAAGAVEDKARSLTHSGKDAGKDLSKCAPAPHCFLAPANSSVFCSLLASCSNVHLLFRSRAGCCTENSFALMQHARCWSRSLNMCSGIQIFLASRKEGWKLCGATWPDMGVICAYRHAKHAKEEAKDALPDEHHGFLGGFRGWLADRKASSWHHINLRGGDRAAFCGPCCSGVCL